MSSGRAQQVTAGDPKRPAEVRQYERPEASPSGEQQPDVALMFASICGAAGVWFQLKWITLVGLILVLSSLARASKSAGMDYRQLMTTTAFLSVALLGPYVIPVLQKITGKGKAAGPTADS